MEKLKIQDLEEGKLYTFTFEDNLKCAFVHRIKSNRLQVKSTEFGWEDSSFSYNNVISGYFEEIKREIDWSMVPRGTKVQVRDKAEEEWVNKYFIEFNSRKEDFPFFASPCLDDNFSDYKMENNGYEWIYCRIHPSVEIPDEWYKEVE